MNQVILTPLQKQLYQMNPQQSHPKLSLRRVLWIKLLRWIDKASVQAIWKAILRALTLLAVSLGVMFPQFMLGVLTSTAKWNGYRIPLFCLLLCATLNAKRCWLWIRRTRVRRRGSNQHTYRGLPVGEFASWLMETRAFKRDEAMTKWALSQGKFQKIAEELEDHGVLKRGEVNNARVLRDITLEQLVLQLRDKFPLVWSEERQVWAERTGAFERWALKEDAAERKRKKVIERQERKIDRNQEKIAQQSSMADVLALCQ